MSTYTSEPGTRLAGRYRLVDQVVAGSGWANWKAVDETLARPVSVLTFAPGFPRIPHVVTAARAASRLTDPRMAQVFDVEDGNGQAYVVLEWVGGETLTSMLAAGPLDAARACALIGEAARALAGAHAVGQAHLRLTPEALRWTRSSGIKITGLGIDAALAGDGLTGAAAQDPAVADTIALAGLLYAALTGYWPGEQPTGLPAAPVSDGVVCTPRQVLAGIPPAVDSVVARALLQQPTRQGPPIQTPGAFADALAEVAPPTPLPEPAPATPRGYGGGSGYGGYGPDPDNPDSWATPNRGGSRGTAPYPQRDPSGPYPPDGGGYPGPRAGGYGRDAYPGTTRGGTNRVMLAVVAVLAVTVIGVIIWTVLPHSSGGTPAANGGTSSAKAKSQSTTHPAATALTPVNVSTFNIFGKPPGNTEDKQTAGNAIDGDPSTAWATSYYFGSSNFAGLKPGTGLLIDMGKKIQLSQVAVKFGSKGSTTAEIYLGNSKAMSKTALSNFTLVSPSGTASGKHVFPVTSKATGRYVLIWLTNLPPMVHPPASAVASAKGKPIFQALIYNVAIRGSAASGTS